MSNAASAGGGSGESSISEGNHYHQPDQYSDQIGMAYTTDDRRAAEQMHGGNQRNPSASTSQHLHPSHQAPSPGVLQTDFAAQSSAQATSHPSIAAGPSAYPQNRFYGLSRDLSGPSADSAFLPSPSNALRPMVANMDLQHASASTGTTGERAGSSSRSGNSSRTPSIASGSQSNLPAMPSMTTHGRPAPPSSATGQPDGSSQFSIEVIATSFDKRGYPIFSGRAARIRGIIRLRAIAGCHVEIKLGAYICQGSPAAVWDGVALMPPESGHDHKLFTIRENIPLNDSMMRTREGISPTTAGSDDFIFETPFDFNLPLGMSTRFVNGEATVAAVALPPSFEISSESISREKELIRSTNNSLKSSAASVRSRSSRLTSLAATTTSVGNTIRDVMEKGFGEVYRLGCFYTMEFSLIRTPSADSTPKKKLFGKSKTSKPTVLDTITVPFVFLGEQSSEQPPPLSIPATLIANAVARPGSFLGDGWQCEHASAKWPGKGAKNVKRQLDIEMHMPFPATMHAPSLFPVLIILRPHDPKLLSAVPIDFIPTSPIQDEGTWSKGSSGGGGAGGTSSAHSRQSSVSTQRARNSSVHHQSTPEIQSEERMPSNDHQENESGGMLSRFMRSSLSLSRNPSNPALSGMTNSQSSHSLRHVQSQSETSHLEDFEPSHTSGSTAGGKTGAAQSIRDAMSSKLGRRRPNTAPTSHSSSDGRSRASGSTMLGSGGQYIGNLSGLVRVSLVQTTFCIGSGPSEPPKNIRKLVSMAEVEELEPEALRTMVRSTNTSANGQNGPEEQEDEHQALLREVLGEQLGNKGVRVLRALFRVGSDPTPSFRCQGIELRYAIKVDLVPFQVRDKSYRNRPGSGGTIGVSASSAPSSAGAQSEAGGSGSGRGGHQAYNSLSSPTRATNAVPAGMVTNESSLSSPISRNAPHLSPRLPSYRSSTEVPRSEQGQSTVPASVTGSTLGGSQDVFKNNPPHFSSGETVVSTVYADRVNSLDKIEKGVGVLFSTVRMVRAAV
ncbi:uncharacterized protein FA14DRAFT_83070 [Meira miltonrushii]|uniref:Uncharacterized protein n=1 Tax=Meira miltonrushii TaxID=1280837 RepID=A0A316V4I5_9BASI|nr:uncharacterized protein FA14DRAFT_83070 [Meira miltonrushii]PWN31928.1 hypothetical protein FA14DRAFT_83070 [Meira miltonrushii]